jgi:hypothetical protein
MGDMRASARISQIQSTSGSSSGSINNEIELPKRDPNVTLNYNNSLGL